MKIVRVVTSLHFGGVERRLVNLSEASDRDEWIFVGIERGGEAANQIRKNGKRVEIMDVSGRIPSWKAFWRLFRFFRSERPDVVHTSGAESNFHGILAAKLSGVKRLVAEEIGIPNQSFVAKRVFSLLYGLVDVVAANSEDVVDFLHSQNRVDLGRIHLIPNPVLKPNRAPIPRSRDGRFEILIVSRIEPVKNIKGVLNAMPNLLSQNPNVKLTIVGDGSQKVELFRLVQEMGLNHAVDFRGFREAPWDAIETADLFVLNSNTEGFSNALAEAMALGIPSLATAVGAAPQMIEEGESGWLVSPGLDEELLAKLLHIIDMPRARLEQVGKCALDSILAKYSLSRHVDQLMEVYVPGLQFE